MNHAPRGGTDRYGKHYGGGEFLPFYVPRPMMPQVDDLPRMIADAVNDAGCEVTVVEPPKLRAHQRVNHMLAQAMPPAVKRFPVVVSSDGYIIDGNHRWWNAVREGREFIAAIRLRLPFDAALEWLAPRPYVTHANPIDRL